MALYCWTQLWQLRDPWYWTPSCMDSRCVSRDADRAGSQKLSISSTSTSDTVPSCSSKPSKLGDTRPHRLELLVGSSISGKRGPRSRRYDETRLPYRSGMGQDARHPVVETNTWKFSLGPHTSCWRWSISITNNHPEARCCLEGKSATSQIACSSLHKVES